MEPAEIDIKPIIPENDDIPDLTAPPAGAGKFKHSGSRYEDVWPEDVHAAFMEAVALYPPMGKRRLKYYRLGVSARENERASDNRPKSFGRCQLIQSYILEKTGKNRSRKQVSSHLQRLKKIYKDNPAMQPLFSERPPHPSESFSTPQDRPKNISVSPSHFKSDFDLSVNPQKTDTDDLGSSTHLFASEVSSPNSLDGGPYHAFISSTNSPSFASFQQFMSLQRRPAVAPYFSSHDDYPSKLQDTTLFKDGMSEGTRSASALNNHGLPTSLRRFTPRLPAPARPVDSNPTLPFSRAAHPLGVQASPQWISWQNLMDVYYHSSPTSDQEVFHTPYLPSQLTPLERRLYPGLASEWLWPKNPDLSFDPREGSLAELRLRYPSTTYHRGSAYAETRNNTPGSGFNNSLPALDETSPFPQRGSFSYTLTNLANSEASCFPREVSYSYVPESSPSTDVLHESAIDLPKQSSQLSEDFASPFVTSPTPTYPVSYVHSDIHPNTAYSGSFTPVPRFHS